MRWKKHTTHTFLEVSKMNRTRIDTFLLFTSHAHKNIKCVSELNAKYHTYNTYRTDVQWTFNAPWLYRMNRDTVKRKLTASDHVSPHLAWLRERNRYIRTRGVVCNEDVLTNTMRFFRFFFVCSVIEYEKKCLRSIVEFVLVKWNEMGCVFHFSLFSFTQVQENSEKSKTKRKNIWILFVLFYKQKCSSLLHTRMPG